MCEIAEEARARGYTPCSIGRTQKHHIISFSMARGNKAVREILKSNPPELIAYICSAHNVGRIVDTPWARRALLLRKAEVFGIEHMRSYVNSLPWKMKSYDRTFEGMTGMRLG